MKILKILVSSFILVNSINASICQPCGVAQIPGSPFTQNILNPVAAFYSSTSRALIVVNNQNSTVSSFCVNDCNCSITPVTNVVDSSLTNSSYGTASPCGNCIAVSNFGLTIPGPGTVSLFSVDQSNCSLTLTDPAKETNGSNAVGLSFSPNGDFLAVANEFSKNISIFRVYKTNCTLDFIDLFETGSDPIPATAAPIMLSYSPDGKFLVVVIVNLTNGTGSIGIYNVNQTTGELSNFNTFPSGGSFPTGIAFSPNGKFIAVTNSDLLGTSPGSTVLFSFNNGTISQISSLESMDSRPIMLSFSPDSKCLAIANSMNDSISIANVDTITGQLSFLNPKIITGSFPRTAIYSPDGSCLVVANSGFNPTIQPPQPIDNRGSISIFRTNYLRSNLSRAVFAKYCVGCRS